MQVNILTKFGEEWAKNMASRVFNKVIVDDKYKMMDKGHSE